MESIRERHLEIIAIIDYLCYNVSVAISYTCGDRKEVIMEEIIIGFLISIMANIAAYYVCKWLDRDSNDN